MIIAIIFAVLLAGGGTAFYFLKIAKPSVPAPPPEILVEITPKDGLMMNIGNESMIKVGITLGYTNEKAATIITEKKPVLTDVIIQFFGEKTREDVVDSQAIQNHLVETMQETLPEAEITNVYFTQYIYQ